MVTFLDYLESIKENSFKTKARIELLRKRDESVYKTIEGDIISGSINISNTNGVRRTTSITLDNSSKDYIPNEYNLWINSQFNLSIGVECSNGEYYYLKMGSFVIQNPVLNIGEGNNNINISGIDKFSLLDGGNKGILKASYQINLGYGLPSAIKGVLNNFGIQKTPLIHSFYSDKTIPFNIIEPYGSNGKSLLMQLQKIYSSNMYFDTNGRFIFEPDFDDNSKGPVHHFKIGDYHYIGSSQTIDYQSVKNYILVIGDNINGATFSAVVKNENLQSPTRIQLIGEVIDIVEDSNLNSYELAKSLGEYYLKREMVLSSNITISIVPLLHLNVDQVVLFSEDGLDLEEERFLINNLNYSFGQNGGSGTVNISKTSDLLIG